MSICRFRFGHLTAGESVFEVDSGELAERVRDLIDELCESDGEHYQVYFTTSDGSSMTIFQSGLLSYSSSPINYHPLYYLPESRDNVYVIATGFLADTMGQWIDRFALTYDVPSDHTDLFARAAVYRLHNAAFENNLAEVTRLIGAGYKVDELDNKHRTPLILSAAQGHLDVCRYLVDHGANTHAKDNWGNSILSIAKGYPELVAYFKMFDLQ